MAAAHYLLPAGDGTMNHMMGMMIGSSAENIIHAGSNKAWTLINRISLFRSYRLTISKTQDSAIFLKLQKYVLSKYISSIKQCDLVEEHGDIMLSLKNSSRFLRPVVEVYEGHTVTIHIDEEHLKKDDSGRGPSHTSDKIVVESKTANVSVLQKYVEHVSQIKMDVRILRVHRATVIRNGAGRDGPTNTAFWDEIETMTNKRIANTVVSKEVEKNLYDDVAKFIRNPEVYNKQGVPYKRGYLLYGPPGTGKTSVIKALANEYGIDIFTIQMDNLDNELFVNLMTGISARTSKRPYILALEDFDRCKLFKPRFDDFNSQGITFPTLLNEIDGVIESYGRILIITANDYDKIMWLPEAAALFRQGRVDKKVQLTYCDDYQMKGIVSQFIPDENKAEFMEKFVVPADIIQQKITPAAVISTIQDIGTDIDMLTDALLTNTGAFINNVVNNNGNQGVVVIKKSRQARLMNNTKYQINRLKRTIKWSEAATKKLGRKKDLLQKAEQRLARMKEVAKVKAKKEKEKKQKEVAKEKAKEKAKKLLEKKRKAKALDDEQAGSKKQKR